MMEAPQVSVVMATYNASKFISEAITSVVNQTLPVFELIIVDDGSSDNTREIVERFSDKRIRYIYQENAGQTVAKNVGIREAKGNFVGFCDSDDYWHLNKLELQIPLFSRDPDVVVVYGGGESVDENGQLLGQQQFGTLRGEVLQELFVENFIPFGTAVVRKSKLDEVHGFNESLRMGIDWDLWLRLAVNYKFECVKEPVYVYRDWHGQMSKNWRGRYKWAFQIMEGFLKLHPGAINSKTRRQAFANTYANRARARCQSEFSNALADTLRAICIDPLSVYNWKTFPRVVVDKLAAVRSDLARID